MGDRSGGNRRHEAVVARITRAVDAGFADHIAIGIGSDDNGVAASDDPTETVWSYLIGPEKGEVTQGAVLVGSVACICSVAVPVALPGRGAACGDVGRSTIGADVPGC